MGDAAEHKRNLRERLALVIFLALMLIGGLILFSYFSTGRDWSVAATFLDDSVGSLDDYSVVVFSGTSEPQTSSQKRKAPVDARSTMQTPYASVNKDSSWNTPTEGISRMVRSVYQRFEKRQETVSDDVVYVSDVRDLYELKGASVATLKVDDPMRYSEPLIIRTKNKAFGVFSVPGYISRVRMKNTIEALRSEGADSIVCIAPRSAMISTYEGIDVVVLTDETQESFEAVREQLNSKNVLVVRSPDRGTTGVVIFSSNNVPAFKTVKEL